MPWGGGGSNNNNNGNSNNNDHPPPYDHPPFPPAPRNRRGRRDDGPPGVSLLVRNVSPDITTNDLHQAFSRIGVVRDVYIPRDYHSQQPKGFAFVEYATNEMAREARDEMDRFVMKGRELEVVFAQEKRKTPNEMRGRVVDGGQIERCGRSSSFERHKRREREQQQQRNMENNNDNYRG